MLEGMCCLIFNLILLDKVFSLIRYMSFHSISLSCFSSFHETAQIALLTFCRLSSDHEFYCEFCLSNCVLSPFKVFSMSLETPYKTHTTTTHYAHNDSINVCRTKWGSVHIELWFGCVQKI